MQVTNKPAEVGPVDVVICAVKNYHLEDAAVQMKPLIGDNTVVLPLQNGVTAAERLATILGRRHVLGYATLRPNSIGELDGPGSPRVKAIWTVLTGAGVQIDAVDDIHVSLWNKLLAYAGVSPTLFLSGLVGLAAL